MPEPKQGPAAAAPATAGLRWVETKMPITRRADELDAHLKVLDDFEEAHLEEVNSTGGPIYITTRQIVKLRSDLDEACRREADYVSAYWSSICDRLRAELVAAGELLQCWLSEAPGDPETHEWLARNGFKDPYPECWQRDGDKPATESEARDA
jgi:hypothetical protein